MTEPKLLHIHSQYAHHDPACIVGNLAGLEALKDAIQRALDDYSGTNTWEGRSDVSAADGEHYDVRVLLDDSPWNSPTWLKRAEPYTADYARENREDAIWPWVHLQP